ncbi:hypothetical protein [Ferrimonas sp. SCSIO 43195]|uniref:hypothetical protein n=1 Tax=Ferrimonas sp. SCSIO 43195 TaxID=2822844 RepID=UPI002076339E|nr:hypothetical protein [Ferrimonas sp. SCSIO 43195]USD35972.1 hypothetical protein J8Z22_13085 [Ferrimonas sp. SCSIO 43195]
MTLTHILFALTLVMSLGAQAQCDAQPQRLIAHYSLEQPGKAVRSLELVRLDNQVALHWADDGLTERWTRLTGGQLRLERLFDQYQRAIEYQPEDLKALNSERAWKRQWQLLDPVALNALTVTTTSGDGCDHHQHRSGAGTELVWLPDLQLVQSLSSPSQTLTLLQLNHSDIDVQQRMQHWDQFAATDYADVGDNEQDPLLSKMIIQGFSRRQANTINHHHGHDH